jgi:hypothetical protein
MKGRYQIWLSLGVSCLFVILPCAGYGASLTMTIGNTVSVNGNMNATSFTGDGSGLTNVGGSSACTSISSIPTTITVPGVYCLKSDLATAMTLGNAIEILADNVVIDLNGHMLDGLAAGTDTQTKGIYSNQRQNITIRNGRIRGFNVGVSLDDTSSSTSLGHVIEYIRADQNTMAGLIAKGTGPLIRNNQVVASGASTLYTDSFGVGIEADGPASRVVNNDIINVSARGTGGAYGIYLGSALGSVVVHNRVSQVTSPSGEACGIISFSADGTVISGNQITNYTVPTSSYTGIHLYNAQDQVVSDNRIVGMDKGILFDNGATGKYMNNLTQGVATPYTGGTAAGSTNY